MTVTSIHRRPMCPTRAAMTEMWRPVVGHPDYDVSWDGRVRNIWTGRVLKPQPTRIRNGEARYLKVNLGRACQRMVHLLVADAWHKRPETGMPLVVDHVDNEGTRNCATNLRWLTYSMNTRQWYAMNARFEAAGLQNGWDLGPEADMQEWHTVFERLQAAGL